MIWFDKVQRFGLENRENQHNFIKFGEMAEWIKALVLKIRECNSSVGSNPTLSSKGLTVPCQYSYDPLKHYKYGSGSAQEVMRAIR